MMRNKKRILFFLVTVLPSLPLAVMALLWMHPSVPCLPQNDEEVSLEVVPRQQGTQEEVTPPPFMPQPHLQGTGKGNGQADDVDPNTIRLSEIQDINKRGKFQKQRVSRLCSKYVFPREQRLPQRDDLRLFFRHLMFDDKREAIFCFVPKIGCTDMKRLMLYMGGHLPLDTVDWPWVEDSVYLEPALSRASLMNKTLLTNQKITRIQTYYKFMIVRNPLERLVSAYRNKIEPPVSRKRLNKFPHFLKVEILEQFRSYELRSWKAGSKFNISVTFPEFVQYFIETDVVMMNEHFRPSFDICHPCLIKYDFYGNFRNYSSDVRQLIEKFNTSKEFYRDKSLHSSSEQTSKKLASYYRQLSYRERVRLVGKLYDDLLFYYTLYPAERHSHVELLGIDYPIL